MKHKNMVEYSWLPFLKMDHWIKWYMYRVYNEDNVVSKNANGTTEWNHIVITDVMLQDVGLILLNNILQSDY